MTLARRNLFKAALAGVAGSAVAGGGALAAPACAGPSAPRWGRGPEGQRAADLGDGTYLNPIIAGDHPDPTILKDGADYYMTFTSFEVSPGLVIWRSGDLVNWTPVGPALTKPLGNVFAVDLVKHKGRYFIYIPADVAGRGFSLYVIWADDIRGPWSDPIDLKVIGCIDPGHIVGEDGKRYLFVNGVRRVRLTDDGLAADGALEPAYQPWRYPDDWIVEDFAPEGPKLMRRGEWFYLINAVGGTAGPPTGHMVIAARSKSVHGPWEYCPHNPLVRTKRVSEPWWSRGHASLVEGPAGDWWMVYHGYENGFRTLGRQTLLEPIEWTDDGWFRAKGGDLSAPLPKPRAGRSGPSGRPLSDDFSSERFGVQWGFEAAGPEERARATYEPSGLRIRARGSSPADCSPLTCIIGDRAYEAEVSIDLLDGTEGGLLLFYSPKAFLGLGFGAEGLKTFLNSEEQPWMRVPLGVSALRLKVTNDANIVSWRYSHDEGKTWIRQDIRNEVSGFNHNTFGGFVSLKVGIYAAGKGEIRLRDFKYRAFEPSAA